MVLPVVIQEAILEEANIKINSVKAFPCLSQCILHKTGQTIGENTLRRLFGNLGDVKSPRPQTLEILAEFVGYPSWEKMFAELCPSDSQFKENVFTVRIDSLGEGQAIRLEYYPDRVLTLVSTGLGHEVIVSDSVNSSLREGDVLTISTLAVGYPLMSSHVVRDGKCLGSYIAGEKYGIASITVL